MLRKGLFLQVLCAAALLTSCAKQEASTPAPAANLPHATVVLRDGTRVAGAIAATSATEITVNLDAGGTRTIPMKDVRRVDYGETATTAQPAPPPTAPSAPSPAPPPPAPVEPTHEEHLHATADQVRSTTRVLPVGTEVPVRTEETIDSSK